MSSNQSGEGEIRKAMIEHDAVDCMVALPGQLFYSTQIPACLWFLARDKSNGKRGQETLRDRRGEVLFIDARKMGKMVDRTRRELTDDDIQKIADTYHAWRSVAGTQINAPNTARTESVGAQFIAPNTARTDSLRPTHATTNPGAMNRAPTKTSQASANPPRWMKSASTAMCSPPAVTSVPKPPKMTANPSPTR